MLGGFTIIPHGHHREIGLSALRNISLKKACKCANQWRSVLHEGRAQIKERNKQKREAMRNLHYLKDIALDTFESHKTELKKDAKEGNWFLALKLHIFLKCNCLPILKITPTEIRDTRTPI